MTANIRVPATLVQATALPKGGGDYTRSYSEPGRIFFTRVTS